MEILPSLTSDTSQLALSTDFLASLKTPQDYEAAFQFVTEQKNQRVWWEADLILSYYKKYLRPLDVYRAGQLMNDSTVKYYLRTASGFPPEFRIPNISFNHHYQATYADQWDSKTLRFSGDKRFDFAGKAADNGWSTRKLKFEMEQEKEKEAKKLEELVCGLCLVITPEKVHMFSLYKNGTPKTKPLNFSAHERCVKEYLGPAGKFYE